MKGKLTETLILAASKLVRQMSKSGMKVVIDDDRHSPDRKVLKAPIHIYNLLFPFFIKYVKILDDWHFLGELNGLIIPI